MVNQKRSPRCSKKKRLGCSVLLFGSSRNNHGRLMTAHVKHPRHRFDHLACYRYAKQAEIEPHKANSSAFTSRYYQLSHSLSIRLSRAIARARAAATFPRFGQARQLSRLSRGSPECKSPPRVRRAAPDQPQTYYARASHYYTDTCGVKAGHADSGRGCAQVDLDRGRAESLSVKCQVQFARTRHAAGRIKDEPRATARPVPTPPCATRFSPCARASRVRVHCGLLPFPLEKSKALSNSQESGRRRRRGRGRAVRSAKRVFAIDGVPEQLIVAVKSQRESADDRNIASIARF